MRSLIPDRPIAFNREFVALKVGINGALFLSQCVYWSRRTGKGDGWFYKTAEEWEEETGLTRREQETARKKLKEKGYIDELRKGLPAKVFYRINEDKIAADLDALNQPNKIGGKRQTVMAESANHYYTETTTETTTDITRAKAPKRAQFSSLSQAEQEEVYSYAAKEAAMNGLSSSDVDQFLDHHAAKGSKFVDWKAAWRTWQANAKKFSRKKSTGIDPALLRGEF